MKRLVVAFSLLIGLVFADILTTITGLSQGAADLNPLFHAQGFQTFLLCKLFFSLLSIPLFSIAYCYLKAKFPQYVKVIWACLLVLIVFYMGTLANNITVLLKIQNLQP